MCVATKDFFDIHGAWETFRAAKRLFSRMGFAECVEILENDAGHNYNTLQREGVARWMARWLLADDHPITEPAIKLLSESEYQCAPGGQVMLLPGARSAYDLNGDYERELAGRRAASWKGGNSSELLARVRQIAGIRALGELSRPQAERLDTIRRTGYRIEKLLLKPEDGIVLPALVLLPDKPQPGRVVVYVHEQGKAADASPGGPIEALLREGKTVLAIDVCGAGQTRPSNPEWQDVFVAYLLGRSYVGLRGEYPCRGTLRSGVGWGYGRSGPGGGRTGGNPCAARGGRRAEALSLGETGPHAPFVVRHRERTAHEGVSGGSSVRRLAGVRLARSCRQPGHEALDRAAGERGGTARELAPLLAPKGRNTSAQGKRSAALGEEIETPEAPKGRNNGLRRRKLPSRLV